MKVKLKDEGFFSLTIEAGKLWLEVGHEYRESNSPIEITKADLVSIIKACQAAREVIT